MSDPRRWIIFTAATGNQRGGEEKGAELLHLARRSTTQLLVFPCPITFLVEENKKKQRRNPCRTFAKNGTRKSWKNLTGYIHYSIPLFFSYYSSFLLSLSLFLSCLSWTCFKSGSNDCIQRNCEEINGQELSINFLTNPFCRRRGVARREVVPRTRETRLPRSRRFVSFFRAPWPFLFIVSDAVHRYSKASMFSLSFTGGERIRWKCRLKVVNGETNWIYFIRVMSRINLWL